MDYSPQGWEIETRAGGEIKLDLWITPQAGENPQSIARSRDTIKRIYWIYGLQPAGLGDKRCATSDIYFQGYKDK